MSYLLKPILSLVKKCATLIFEYIVGSQSGSGVVFLSQRVPFGYELRMAQNKFIIRLKYLSMFSEINFYFFFFNLFS